MIMHAFSSKYLIFSLLLFLLIPVQRASQGSDWPDWRGPARDGISQEKGLPDKWSPSGENLLWRAPYGGRSAPIVMNNRVYLLNPVGAGESLQERVCCLDADTGKMIWEHRFNVFLSDVPPHRIAWASPTGDPATGNIYALGVGGTLLCLSRDGKVLWERYLTEEFGQWTTHGGRTVSPIIEGDLVIVSGVTEGWGDNAMRRHRFMAFDKKTGESVWTVLPGGRPFDTTYSTPIAADINGTRLIIAGGGDGSVYAMKAQTGEPVWTYAISKRGINTSVILKGTTAIVSHGEENLDTSEMGLLAAIDATAKGKIGKDQIKWSVTKFLGGYSSPVLDGDRIYQIDNGSNLAAFDVNTGEQLWTQNLGTVQKASLVLADGKLYVGTESGEFFILKPGPDKCEILDKDQLGDEGAFEKIIASVAVSHGRMYLVSEAAIYCIGKKSGSSRPSTAASQSAAAGSGEVAHVQVVPNDILIKPGESVRFRVRLFDHKGRFLREGGATWSLDGLKGEIRDGQFTASSEKTGQAGLIKATVGQVTGTAGVRVIPSPPWTEDFEAIAAGSVPRHWLNTTSKYAVRDLEGNKALVKNPNPPGLKRAQSFMGPHGMSDYTVEADVRAVERRRQMGDAGVIAQRYQLTLWGGHQRLTIESWQPETTRTVRVPFKWKADTWYHLKLTVENLPDGKVRARGKAWPVGEAEPSAWMIEKVDSMGNREGSPGLYADAPFDVFFDNIKVTANK
ncbi:MAG: PQQ-like beta-propeller repeat protein [Blastocatellia bacterium]|nr:PQQ-like beta-propeller repeat protein [Blastocatellia bacterium]